MRRMTKCAALMVTMTIAMATAPQKAEASLWGALVELTESNYENWQLNFEVWNNTGRKVDLKIDRWDDYIPGYWDWHSTGGGSLQTGETAGLWNASGTYRIRLRTWNSNKKRWVLKDQIYVHSPGPYFIEAYKAGRNDFRLRRW